MTIMDVIELSRELGKAIQADDRYIAYHLARQANDEDEQLQALIHGFNLKRMELQSEVGKPNKDEEKVKELNEVIQTSYQSIMANPKMMVYQSAKESYDAMMNQVNTVISMSANGIDPETIDVNAVCGGDCSTCGGCS